MADWTSNTGYEPNDQMDNFQEKAFFGFSEELAPGRSQSSSRKSVASTVPTVFDSSVGQSSGKPERDCVSETSLSSQRTKCRKLESRSVHNGGFDVER